MSSVKDNVGRGLNIALVNGEFPMEQRRKAGWQPATLCPHAHSRKSQGGPRAVGGSVWELKVPQKR